MLNLVLYSSSVEQPCDWHSTLHAPCAFALFHHSLGDTQAEPQDGALALPESFTATSGEVPIRRETSQFDCLGGSGYQVSHAASPAPATWHVLYPTTPKLP